jgi:hypothetical protein
MKKDYLDIPEETLVIDGVNYPARYRAGGVEYRDLPLYAVAQEPINWVTAPQWAQDYFHQVRSELSTGACKNCGHDIRMMVMSGTGFCSMNCQDEFDAPKALAS